MTIVREIRPKILLAAAAFGAALGLPTALWSAGDLSRQAPVEVTVDLGKPGEHVFVPPRPARHDRRDRNRVARLNIRARSARGACRTRPAWSRRSRSSCWPCRSGGPA